MLRRLQHRIVARAFGFETEAAEGEPDERMEPEHGLYDHVERRRQVVASPDVGKLVGKDRFDVQVV